MNAQAPAVPLAPPAIDPTASAVIQELEVIGRRPGPALWTVRRGDSSVVILGGVSPLPHMLEWNTIRVERAMDGANLVLLPPAGRAGVLDILSILFHAGDLQLPVGQTLTSLMSTDERARFDNLRNQIHTDAKRYERLKPAIAGLFLLSDFLKAAGLSAAKPASTVKRLAEQKHIRVKTVGDIDIGQFFRSESRMDAAQNKACFDAALTDAEWDASRARPVADAWANGDLRAVRAEYFGAFMDACVLKLPTLRAMLDKGEAEAVAAIDAALIKPGKTVAVIDLSLLLRANGVLDRLKAEGADITVPPD